MPLATKISLRQRYRHLRRQLSPEKKLTASQALSNIFLDRFMGSKNTIAVYLAHDGELNLMPLVEKLWQTSCSLFLPIIQSDTQILRFVKYTPATFLKKNQHHIFEPFERENSLVYIMPYDLDVVLLPMVAFNDVGARLGMGKGFYDKCFSFCRYLSKRPLLIGVAYECQYCAELPVDEWDVPLDGVITEKTLMLFNKTRKHEQSIFSL